MIADRRLARGVMAAAVTGVLAGAAFVLSDRAPVIVGDVPSRVADSTFWQMMSTMSEPNGFFRSDNFVSNETAFQRVIPELMQRVGTGGVYVGVGPDQNFTYLVAFKPRIAFIVDIRRQNAMLHLMYKALIEMSADRADFLARLFSRPRPPGLTEQSTASELLSAFEVVTPDGMLRDATMEGIIAQLRVTHGFPLDPEDLESIAYVHNAFYEGGPMLTYSSGQLARRGTRAFNNRMPTYASQMEQDDGNGAQRSYLSSEANFRVLKDLESRNVIIPIVGDFAGDEALPAVAKWLKQHGATLSLFYTSNVEQYLFQQGDDWYRFYKNIALFPLSDSSTFIRSVFNRGVMNPGRMASGTFPSAQLVLSVRELLDGVRSRRVRNYYDVISLSH